MKRTIRRAIKNIFNLMPEGLKKQGLLLLRSIYTPGPALRASLTFNGSFHVKIDEKHSFKLWHTGNWIENDFFWLGINGYEKISVETWIKACTYSQVIFDIGANTGLFSLIAKCVNPNAQVYAFEPVPVFNSGLKKNAILNDYEIVIEQKAVADKLGKAEFYFPTAGNVYSATLSQQHYKEHNSDDFVKLEVEVDTLQSFIETNQIMQIDLIKIDAEGFDYEVLKGMGPYLKKYLPNILIEVHSDEVGAKIEQLLPEKQYSFYNIDEVNKPILQKKLGKSSSLNFFICNNRTAELIFSKDI